MSLMAGLPLHAEKAVTGRLLGFEVLAPNLSLLESQGYRDAGARLKERLCWFTNEALDDPDDCQPLGLFLADLVGELQAEVARLPAGAGEAAACALTEFATLVTAFDATPHDPLERLVAAVAQTAADCYEVFQTTVPPTLWQRTRPAASFLGGKVCLSFSPDVHLQVRTEFGAEDQPSARVLLTISPRWLDAETIATLPRALLHEYIAHVPQGPYLGARAHPDANDLFAEGWMDYIAHSIHRSALERRGPCKPLSNYLVLTWMSLYDVAAERFFAARCSLQDGDPVAAARFEGAAAARQMHDLLRRLPETAGQADEHLYRLSFGLNASKLDSLSRRRFAAEVRRCLLRASRSDTLVEALRAWVAGRIKLEDLSTRLLD
jgi:hypothetical protein